MESLDIRQQLLEYTANADEDKVQAIYTLVKEDAVSLTVPHEHWELIHEALKKDKEGATYSPWEEVMHRIQEKNGI